MSNSNLPCVYEMVDEDPRFHQTVDKKTGYRTKAMLTMPLMAGETVVGVVQLINKKNGGQFTSQDEELLESFLGIAGPILAVSLSVNGCNVMQVSYKSHHLQTSRVFHRHSISLSEFDFASSVAVEKAVRKTHELKEQSQLQPSIEEVEEEEDDEEDR